MALEIFTQFLNQTHPHLLLLKNQTNQWLTVSGQSNKHSNVLIAPHAMNETACRTTVTTEIEQYVVCIM